MSALILTLSDFENCVGQELPVSAESDLAPTDVLKLVEAVKKSSPAFEGREPFGLIFQGPKDAALEQQTVFIHHPDHGPLPIFIVPVAADEALVSYEAIFA